MITASKLKSILNKEYTGPSELSLGEGLSVRISPKGKIVFQYRYRYDGKSVRLKLGAFPDLSIADAFLLVKGHRLSLRGDIDPRNKNKSSYRGVGDIQDPTLDNCITFWFENYCKIKRKTPDEILYRVRNLISPHWLSQKIAPMQRIHFSGLFSSMVEKSIESGSKKGYSFNCIIELRAALRFCHRQGYINNGSFEQLLPNDFTKDYEPREHYLSLNECQRIWANIDRLPLTDRNRLILRCVMIFGCRTNELITAQKADFDLENNLFTVRRENTKGNLTQIIRPIPWNLRAELQRQKDSNPAFKYMFCNLWGEDKPANPASVSRIAHTCYTHLENLREFRMHDFRRTLTTHLTDAGCPLQFTEKLLGHRMKGVLAIYNKSPMLEGLREWTDKWVAMLEGGSL